MSTTAMPTTPPAIELTADQLELQQRARDVRRERADAARARGRGARRPAARGDRRARSSARRSPRGCNGGRFAAEHGGQGWSMLEWFLVNEQFGRVTNGLHWHVPSAYNVLIAGHARADRALPGAGAARRGRRRLRGHRGRGRLRSGRDRHAPRCATDGGWRINGEKWFVTSGDVARVLIVMANVVDGADRLPTLFLVEPERAGRRVRRRPAVHPQLSRTAIRRSASPTSRSAADAVIGGIGNGEELQRALVHRGAPRDRHPRPRRDVAAARRDDRRGR